MTLFNPSWENRKRMNNKPVLMIHEILPWMLHPSLENYILTFDDGLYSQYFHLDFFKKLNTPKIFFISTEIICPEEQKQNSDFLPCAKAHEEFFKNGDASNYMKWSQVHEIANTPQCFIGGHSHAHHKNQDLSIKELFGALKVDTLKMMDTFKRENLAIEHFCFPYNKEHPLYKEILKQHDIKYFYGDERISIESIKEKLLSGEIK